MPVFNEYLEQRLYDWCIKRNPNAGKVLVCEWKDFAKQFESLDVYEACKKLEEVGYKVDESAIQMFGYDPYKIIMHNLGVQ
jgi:hypothetical protein